LIPSIRKALNEFLSEQKERLTEKTYKGYESVIELFTIFLNGYGHTSFDGDEHENLFQAMENGIEFIDIFGVEKITYPAIHEFLGYFLIRKAMVSESFLKTTGTVMKKLVKWLYDQQYISKEEFEEQMEIVNELKDDLPLVERVGRLLFELHKFSSITEENFEEYGEDYFTITKVEKRKLWLQGDLNLDLEIGPVIVTEEISSLCKTGWQVYLSLGLKKRKMVHPLVIKCLSIILTKSKIHLYPNLLSHTDLFGIWFGQQ